MSVTIRLSRIGKKRAPAFKIVAATTKSKLNGRSVEILGHYNPSHNPALLKLDGERLDYWKKNGAIISPTVEKLSQGTYEFAPYTRQNEAKEEESETPAAAAEAPVAEAEAQTEEVETPAVEAAETPEVSEAQE